ncbi:conserved hypothetical protein [Pyrenophora tritici-repentis Pt-1C-BFP]|uniref:Rhodopsin domain-containing protein n=1 Tax=Pyrenophora tritici-repentis (strain Pt-1C-BFP) TaxID=426418 RepID=B2WHW3_PYRTR|nr:uncharacterized protein PTRG_09572 [Pyrenophora tritici-repentis Pt-1C-BFP]EDU42623.1 conserved hypothetical protein [Pyrenophora tritici-repentis Pt-1C-BFP]
MANAVASWAVIPIEGILMGLSLLLASGRLVPRFAQRHYPTVSDSLLIVSILDVIGLFITDTMTYKLGGMSEEEMEASVSQVIALKKVQFAGNAFYDTGIYWPKLAILALYFRLIPKTMPTLRKVLYVVSTFTLCAMVTTFFLDTFWCVVLSMAEMAVAIMVVSLPSMRSFLRRDGIFSSNKKSHSSSSNGAYGQRTPGTGSQGFIRPTRRVKHSVHVHTEEDSGSEVELNTMARKDVIYETRRVSVQFSRSQDEESGIYGKLP